MINKIKCSLLALLILSSCSNTFIEELKNKQIMTRNENDAKTWCIIIQVSLALYFVENEKYPINFDLFVKENPDLDPQWAGKIAAAKNPTSAIDGYYYEYNLLDNNNYSLIASPSSPGKTGTKKFIVKNNDPIQTRNIDSKDQ